MKTIDNLLRYKFTEEQKLALKTLGISNGCGWAKGFKFINLKNRIEKLPFVDKKRLNKLYWDIEQLCNYNHDIEFYLWGGIIDYFRANYFFALNCIGLLHWTSTKARLGLFLLLLLWLTLFGWRFFNWGARKDINNLYKLL